MDITYNTAGLDKLKKAFSDRSYVKVGVLTEDASRNNDYLVGRYNKFKDDNSIPLKIRKGLIQTYKDNPSNADTGASLEFGIISQKVPARPWLMPSTLSAIADIMKNDTKLTESMAKKGSSQDALKIIGIMVENKIQDAFDSAGSGKWAPLSQITVKLKESSSIGIDTAQLRKAVHSEVVKQ
jgi:hypothetical protein